MFTTREMNQIKTDCEYQVVLTTSTQRVATIGSMDLKEETLHFDIEALIKDACTGDNSYLEFVFSGIRFWISYSTFGDDMSTNITLIPIKDDKLETEKVQSETFEVTLKEADAGAFAADLYWLVKENLC